jgi:2-polyprenyl-6-methoxyphenol hydroxylase-like FAD-dependent oxidoreductase
MIQTKTQVLIVGARSTGLMLGCVLARQGIAGRIIEKSPEFPDSSRAKGFQPRSLEIFEDLGVLDELLSQGRTDTPARFYDNHNKVAGIDFWTRKVRRPRPGVPYPNQLLISTPPVEASLRRLLSSYGVKVELGREFITLDQDDHGVTAQVMKSGGHSTETIRADCLVGCDGGRSTVRKALGLGFDVMTVPGVAHLAGDVELEGLDRSHGRAWLTDDQQLLAVTPLPSTRKWQFQASVLADRDDEFPEPSLELFQQLVDQRCPVPNVRLRNATRASVYQVRRGMVDRHQVGRAFVAGDASHIHSPAGGLGANTGIQDAYNLGWKLGLVLRDHAGPRLLASYHEERHAVARRLLRTNKQAEALLIPGMTPDSAPILGFLHRHLIMPATNVYGVIDILLRAVDQTQVSYRGAALSRDWPWPPRRGLAAGDRAPDATIPDAATGAPTRLFDLFRGIQFTLLAFGGAQAKLAEQVAADYPDLIKPCSIVAPDDGDPDGTLPTLVDPRDHVRRLYGVAEQALVLVRPDGHLGFRSSPANPRALRSYLDRTLGLRPRGMVAAGPDVSRPDTELIRHGYPRSHELTMRS